MKGSWVKLGATGPDEDVFSPRPESKLWDLTIRSELQGDGLGKRKGKKDWGVHPKNSDLLSPPERFYPTRSFQRLAAVAVTAQGEITGIMQNILGTNQGPTIRFCCPSCVLRPGVGSDSRSMLFLGWRLLVQYPRTRRCTPSTSNLMTFLG